MKLDWTPIKDYLANLLELTIQHLPSIAYATLAILLFLYIARITQRISHKFFFKSYQSDTLATLLSVVVKVTVFLLGCFIALSILGLDKAVVSILAGAGVLGLALGLAFQDLAQNIISGFILSAKKPFKIGHWVELGGKEGFARKVSLRATEVESRNGEIYTIPNKDVLQSTITNYFGSGTLRIKFTVGVDYSTDLEEAEKVIVDALSQLDFTRKDKPLQAFAVEFSDSSINFSVRFWINSPDPKGYRVFQHKAIVATHKALRNANINIPFPIRTLINHSALNN